MDQPTTDFGLLRAFEPVVRLTEGEMFVPVGVADYVRHAQLVRDDDTGTHVLAEAGTLDLDRLATLTAAHDGPGLALSAVSMPSGWRERVRRFVPGRRHAFHAGTRLGQVGLLGRVVDTLSRVSLLLRGSVPGGSAAASHELQEAHLHPERPTYHGRVVRSGEWVVCQYWFFYAFNNWRSGFSGVNEHEADWEQVTVFLDGSSPPAEGELPEPRWVVFSAHDEVGDDLRRRWDDPDLTLVDGRHPVVFAGAGSHSGAYLPGDYLITVVPPSWGGLVPAVRRVAKLLAPWARTAQGSGLGVPYVDYARGDGRAIGPGEEQGWHAELVDDATPWVRDYRGLWGHDTRDRLGGERGPAGPRYDRDATVRASWGDPVGWAGLAKVAPGPGAEVRYVGERIADIDERLAELESEADGLRTSLVRRAAALGPDSPEVRALAPDERALSRARMETVRLRDERIRMERALREGAPVADPHDHLLHRRTPIAASERSRDRLLALWAVVSTPIVIYLVARFFRPEVTDKPLAAVVIIALVLGVEAFVRGYFLALVVRLVFLVGAVFLVDQLIVHWQPVVFWTLVTAAVLVLVVNVRDALRR